ncbi:MAG: proline--tRNA ligase [Candidatus Eremiobacteraeota bacterium]|nr:proline--tRNA ligase [Candidatus Eremiobacteraeota bacterium]MBV9262749.1 proline--tRNA ligase [Candidatus Eremiobacteraeota bacterium]
MSDEPAQAVVKEIPPKAADLSAWYTAVCLKAQLVSYSPVRGCVVLRPYGFALWEKLQQHLDARFKQTGHENAYFPLFIPANLLQREAEHVEGFAPEVAWVTRGGGEELTEPLAIRPTSEAIIGVMYAKWIQSHRDLPILINQWANVVRWEKATRPFLRTMEFLWQEGHTAHASAEEARKETLMILDLYRDFAENVAGVPVYAGPKSAGERFPGAVETFAIEALMPDGKALQSGTSHDLGQNFAKAYDIKFADSDRAMKYAHTTSWGVSWRMLGGLIMVHGDDRGLRLPPKMAPLEAVLIPIVRSNDDRAVAVCDATAARLAAAGFRVRLDARDEQPGWKYSEWDVRGVPVRIEIGPRDVDGGTAVLVRRDRQRGDPEQRRSVALADVESNLRGLLDDIAASLYRDAKSFLDAHTVATSDRVEFFELCRNRAGMVDIPWCNRLECEAHVKAVTTATSRVLRPLEGPALCTACGEPAQVRAYFAQSY